MGIALPGTEPVGRRAEVRLRDDVPAILVAVDASAAGKADKCRPRMHLCWLHGMLVAEVAMRLLKLLCILKCAKAGRRLIPEGFYPPKRRQGTARIGWIEQCFHA